MTSKERVTELLADVDKVNFDIACVEDYVERMKDKYGWFNSNCRERTIPLLCKKRESIIKEIAAETDDGEVVRLSTEVCND
jgi:hypothetical protein